ncbi:MAG: AI-2E family transporter [Candidatus Competibacteraceae bacterium]|nr:AI-2E family transporter [Candidatus Competibacteraceae bacterium]
MQAVIALINTLLTAIGLLLLNIPSLMTLSLVVFACSFIPVAGVFLSSTPIVLVALNNGGIMLSLAVVALITFIHLIEGYVLNPWIYGQHLSLNPVLVIIILFVGYHSFGIWGMVLGLPVTLYFLHDVFGVRQETRSTEADL